MKPTVKSRQVNVGLMCFAFRMVWNKILYCQRFWRKHYENPKQPSGNETERDSSACDQCCWW